MRLWHEALIPHLPRQQLLGQHRECCALRGLGWGKPHATVNYVFDHPRSWLAAYHRKVLLEMIRRVYKPDLMWMSLFYRGKHCIADQGGLQSSSGQDEEGFLGVPRAQCRVPQGVFGEPFWQGNCTGGDCVMATEKRLIDVDEFLKWIVKRFHCVPLVGSCDNDSESIKLLLAQAPTVDAVEVVHGHWISLTDCSNAGVYCSVCYKKVWKEDYAWCNRKNKLRSNYCPNCGANMDGGLYEP